MKDFVTDVAVTFALAFVATLVLGLTPLVDSGTDVDAFVSGGVALLRACVLAGLGSIAPKFRGLLARVSE